MHTEVQYENCTGLPEALLLEGMKAARIKTKTKVIITALEELIRKNRISGLKKFKGSAKNNQACSIQSANLIWLLAGNKLLIISIDV
jgi:hypothetical protein